jgi:hypothetical protein
VETLKLPSQSPNLNSFCERWVLSIKSDCISGLILFGEESLRLALKEYIIHYHQERNHQRKENRLLFPAQDFDFVKKEGKIVCQSRLGGVLIYYYKTAA